MKSRCTIAVRIAGLLVAGDMSSDGSNSVSHAVKN